MMRPSDKQARTSMPSDVKSSHSGLVAYNQVEMMFVYVYVLYSGNEVGGYKH